VDDTQGDLAPGLAPTWSAVRKWKPDQMRAPITSASPSSGAAQFRAKPGLLGLVTVSGTPGSSPNSRFNGVTIALDPRRALTACRRRVTTDLPGRSPTCRAAHKGAARTSGWQPLDGRPPRRPTDVPDGTVATFDWSRDGSRLAWLRVEVTGGVVAVDLH
jgi:hypothetical protein